MSQSSFVRRPALLRARGGTRRRIFPALLVLVAGAVAIGVYFVAIDIREFPDQIRRYCRPEDA
jgi:hypothetical protein